MPVSTTTPRQLVPVDHTASGRLANMTACPTAAVHPRCTPVEGISQAQAATARNTAG